jgi:hypothetical protein
MKFLSLIRFFIPFGHSLDRIDNLLIAGTTAEVTGNRLFDLFAGRPRMMIKKVLGSHEHSRGAKTALHSSMFDKGFLQGMEPVSIRRQTFDGNNVCPVTISSQYETGVYRPAI